MKLLPRLFLVPALASVLLAGCSVHGRPSTPASSHESARAASSVEKATRRPAFVETLVVVGPRRSGHAPTKLAAAPAPSQPAYAPASSRELVLDVALDADGSVRNVSTISPAGEERLAPEAVAKLASWVAAQRFAPGGEVTIRLVP